MGRNLLPIEHVFDSIRGVVRLILQVGFDVAHESLSTTQLLCGIELIKSADGAVDLQKLEYIAAIDERNAWCADGARDLVAWVSAHFQESHWTARRWIAAARALPELPLTQRAMRTGALPLVKVCELVRFALEALLPAEQGAQVVKALERLADRLPSDPDSERAYTLDQRRADALVALSSQAIADDADSARARVNLHVDLDALVARDGSGVLESGGVVHPEVASMLCCDSIVQAIVHGDGGHTVGIGRAARNVPEWLYRQLRERDGTCTFPGCHHRRYVKAHHIGWWEWGGPTDLNNLVLVCGFHHKLIHLHGWRVELGKNAGVVHWFRPGYEPYEPNRAPPERADEVDTNGLRQAELVGA